MLSSTKRSVYTAVPPSGLETAARGADKPGRSDLRIYVSEFRGQGARLCTRLRFAIDNAPSTGGQEKRD
jgi:hypothetical protein